MAKYKDIYKKKKGRFVTLDWVRKLRGKSGVYILKKKGAKKPSYIGYSESNVYKTMLRHLQQWNDPTQVRITYPKTGTKAIVKLLPPKKAAKFEERAIFLLNPTDNPKRIKFSEKEKKAAEKEAKQIFGTIGQEAPF